MVGIDAGITLTRLPEPNLNVNYALSDYNLLQRRSPAPPRAQPLLSSSPHS